MVEFEELFKKVIALESYSIQGTDFKVKNCVAAADNDVLKVSICLVSDESTLTIFTELKRHCKS